MPALTRRKCVKILNYYKKNTRGVSLPTLRRRTSHILHRKMCQCVNALYKGSESRTNAKYTRAVAICKNSVYIKKGVPPPKFKCKSE